MKMLTVRALDEKYSNDLAEILSTDEKLHRELSPNSNMVIIDGIEYLKGCMKWENKKRGKCFAIVKNAKAIGSISFSYKDEKTAGIGYWIKSNEWGNGFCSQAFKEMLLIVKGEGYTHVTASIFKSNIASKRLWEKYDAIFLEDTERYYPIIDLSQLNK
nr:GNAT family N-acetyltransferase [uncultured Niameybacter sp.]